MAVRTLTYRDLTAEQRRVGAHKMREKLLAIVSHPFMSHDQKQAVYDRMALLERWEKLEIELPRPAAPPALEAPVDAPLLPTSNPNIS